jgi:hypothetical protein
MLVLNRKLNLYYERKNTILFIVKVLMKAGYVLSFLEKNTELYRIITIYAIERRQN